MARSRIATVATGLASTSTSAGLPLPPGRSTRVEGAKTPPPAIRVTWRRGMSTPVEGASTSAAGREANRPFQGSSFEVEGLRSRACKCGSKGRRGNLAREFFMKRRSHNHSSENSREVDWSGLVRSRNELVIWKRACEPGCTQKSAEFYRACSSYRLVEIVFYHIDICGSAGCIQCSEKLFWKSAKVSPSQGGEIAAALPKQLLTSLSSAP